VKVLICKSRMLLEYDEIRKKKVTKQEPREDSHWYFFN
jgi:hypothetical protein